MLDDESARGVSESTVKDENSGARFRHVILYSFYKTQLQHLELIEAVARISNKGGSKMTVSQIASVENDCISDLVISHRGY